MNQIHTSYKVSKMLKEFLGDGSVEPIIPAYYYEDKKGFGISATREYSGSPAAYQLHDLLSKPFCEAFNRKFVYESNAEKANPLLMSNIAYAYYYGGGMEAVEKALTEMMEGR